MSISRTQERAFGAGRDAAGTNAVFKKNRRLRRTSQRAPVHKSTSSASDYLLPARSLLFPSNPSSLKYSTRSNVSYVDKKNPETRTHLEIAIVHTPKHAKLPQPLRRNPGTRNPKCDSSEESRVVPDVRGSQYGLDFLFVDASFPRKIVMRLEELDRSI